jgi:chemotaxis methyl-accepting protein methylase
VSAASGQAVDEADFLALTRKISAERGFECASYKEKCLRRRIAVRMRARGVHTYHDYARILDEDAPEYERLLDALTINVTRLFRNWEAYASMSANVVPVLWQRDASSIRVWSAGCSSGEEPYSLAILFHLYAAARGTLAQLGRVTVIGTDIDKASLAAAERGEFVEGDFADTPDDLRARYFSSGPPFVVSRAIRELVTFARHDLIAAGAGPPPDSYDLIVCRNVMIYFDREAQERLLDLFRAALAPHGFLVLGKVETLLGRARTLFTPVDARARIFRRC